MCLNCRLIAFYLPQFHPIPENDEWWGKGFTEWTNVAKARPLFRGHYQPHLPADLGFYDLRVPETRLAQAEMARTYGIEGFCYWHYWFEGRRLLERPFNDVLKSGEPDFPFCLAWANETWSGVWHGCPDRILLEQTYPGRSDYEEHFRTVLPALGDHRYITIEGKPVFLVYHPEYMPNPLAFADCWRELACAAGLKGLYLVALDYGGLQPQSAGFDACVPYNPGYWRPENCISFADRQVAKLLRLRGRQRLLPPGLRNLGLRNLTFSKGPALFDYSTVFCRSYTTGSLARHSFPVVMPNWDNTPRSGRRGFLLHNSTPALFAGYLKSALRLVHERVPQERLVFVKSWNEWAEGNHLEPDQRHGLGYLEALREALRVPAS